jgi:thioredoxin
MSDHELEKIRIKKAEILMKHRGMPNEIITIYNINEFNNILEEYSNQIVIVDFWATWCGPCMTFAPVFEKIFQEHSHEIIFLKVNVDLNEAIAKQYGISGIPTTLFIKNRKVIQKIVGATNYNHIKLLIQKIKDYSH